jgi:hypothetical protein
MVSVTDAEFKAICEEWGRGEHFPVKDLDEENVKAAISADPERWWKVLRAVIEESPNAHYGLNLRWLLAPLIEVRGRAWEAVVVREAVTSHKAIAVVAEAFSQLRHAGQTARIDPLRAYELLGRDLVVSTWLQHLREDSNYDWDFWPYDLVDHLIERQPEEAWVVVTAMIEQATPALAGLIGAGFLEDLLGGRLGDLWIERIEELAGRSENFREALANLWIDGDVSAETFLRIERAARIQLDRKRPRGP